MILLKKQFNKKFRLSIFKSNKHLYVQLIDDFKSITLASSSTIQENIKILPLSKREKIYLVGKDIGIKILNLNIDNIFLDKGKNTYCELINILTKGIKISGLKI